MTLGRRPPCNKNEHRPHPLGTHTEQEIKDYVRRQEAHQLFRRAPRKLHGHGVNQLMQMDLLDFQKLSPSNGGIRLPVRRDGDVSVHPHNICVKTGH